TIHGHLVFDGQRTEFSGSGIRDHSWGPRDLNFFNHHAWISGQFPSGRTFMVFSIVDMAGQSANHVLLDDGSGMREAKLVSTPPHLGNIADVDTGYDIVLTTADGHHETIRAEIQQVPFFALGGPSEILFGKQPA